MYTKLKKLFKLFNITDQEIPIFLKGFKITHSDIEDKTKFLDKIDETILDFIAKELKINRNWLYGNSDSIIKEEIGF